MDTTKPLVNRVANSPLITLDLETFLPAEGEVTGIDLKEFLFKGLILREADFRETVKNTDWKVYQDKYVNLYCSADAVIPMWAYMVLTAQLCAYCKDVICATPEQATAIFLSRNLAKLNPDDFKGERIVIKGCGDKKIQEAAYVQITQQLSPVARVIMYGEPCSTVPVFKRSID